MYALGTAESGENIDGDRPPCAVDNGDGVDAKPLSSPFFTASVCLPMRFTVEAFAGVTGHAMGDGVAAIPLSLPPLLMGVEVTLIMMPLLLLLMMFAVAAALLS